MLDASLRKLVAATLTSKSLQYHPANLNRTPPHPNRTQYHLPNLIRTHRIQTALRIREWTLEVYSQQAYNAIP